MKAELVRLTITEKFKHATLSLISLHKERCEHEADRVTLKRGKA